MNTQPSTKSGFVNRFLFYRLLNNSSLVGLLLIGISISSFLLVAPYGNIPLNDDWAYAQACQRMLNGEGFYPSDFTSMPLFIHTIWGSLFCSMFGYSFEVLRVSTAVLSLLGVVTLYYFVHYITKSVTISFLTSLALLFNPIYFSLSLSYMTDVPAAVYMLISTVFFIKYLKLSQAYSFWLATLFSVLAVLVRQTSLAVPIAFAFVYFIRSLSHSQANSRWLNLARSVIPVVITLFALFALNTYLTSHGRTPHLYDVKNKDFLAMLLHPVSNLAHYILSIISFILYLGIFALPVLPYVEKSFLTRNVAVASAVILAIALTVSGFLGKPFLMPLLPNYITTSGVGPLLLSDEYILRVHNLVSLPMLIWVFVTVVSIFCASLLISSSLSFSQEVIANFRNRNSSSCNWEIIFLYTIMIIFLTPVVLTFSYDRYLVSIFAILLILIGYFIKPFFNKDSRSVLQNISYVFITMMAFFTIASTRDYFEWNRTRWTSIQELINSGVKAELIDGGFEFNGFYFYNKSYIQQPTKSWWWVIDDTYRITFGAVAGYTTIAKRPFFRWLTFSTSNIYTLVRTPKHQL